MRADWRALADLDAVSPGLLEEHARVAMRGGGVVFWQPGCVYLGVPYDPLEGEHATTFFVLYCAGDGAVLARHALGLRKLGFSHVVWNRGFRGQERLRKYRIERMARLAILLNG